MKCIGLTGNRVKHPFNRSIVNMRFRLEYHVNVGEGKDYRVPKLGLFLKCTWRVLGTQ